jgi:hypothetical protein
MKNKIKPRALLLSLQPKQRAGLKEEPHKKIAASR